jgi:hypothetical protein
MRRCRHAAFNKHPVHELEIVFVAAVEIFLDRHPW